MTQHNPLDTGHIQNEGHTPPYQTRGIAMGSTVSTNKLAAAFKATKSLEVTASELDVFLSLTQGMTGAKVIVQSNTPAMSSETA